MKVIHIESGLGNQMLSYCELIALKHSNPSETCYVENLVYDLPNANSIICQWNGYELDRIFNINAPNIKDLLTEEQQKLLIDKLLESEFWLHNWNWPVYFSKALNDVGVELKNVRGDFEAKGYSIVATDINRKSSFRDHIRNYEAYKLLQYLYSNFRAQKETKSYSNESIHFYRSSENELTGQRLTFMNINSGIERIESEIRQSFTFPDFVDSQNMGCANSILKCNSVAIHARRGDMLGLNYPLYKYGYFKRCVSYIRHHVDNPVFFIFCDPSSVSWAKENDGVLGLSIKKDDVVFVDWNKGDQSYRDMQLMSLCKHQITTRSSFGWWGSWLNTNPDKITCSPSPLINTTHHF